MFCIIIFLLLGRLLNLSYQNVKIEKYCLLISETNMAEPNDNVIKMATILNLNKNLLCLIIALILGDI